MTEPAGTGVARRRRWRTAAPILALVAAGLAASLPVARRPRLVWNATASAPIGLYRVTPPADLQVGDLVIARPPASVAGLAATRHYLPRGVPLVKRIAGGPGARICAAGVWVSFGPAASIRRLRRDAAGRLLPWWQGCRRLGPGQVLLVMADVPGSFDGRYFGPTAVPDIIGKAYPLWLP
jgi:conjugative transfer signal peptidase TraF